MVFRYHLTSNDSSTTLSCSMSQSRAPLLTQVCPTAFLFCNSQRRRDEGPSMRKVCHLAISMFSMLLLVVSSSGQSAVGMQYWGSFGGGPFDSLNLGNLNNHVVIPIRHKAGRGLAFSYDLTYDSDIWYPTTVNGVKTWQPLSSLQGGYWGWQNLLYSAGSSVTYSTTTT